MKRQGDRETGGQGEVSAPLSPCLPVPLSRSYFLPFAGAAAAPAAAPGLAGGAPFAGAAAPFPGAAPAFAAGALAPAAPAAGAAPVAVAPATAPAAPSATSSLAPPLPPTTILRLATFGSPNTLFCSFHFSASFRRVRRSSRVSTLRCRI